MTYTQAAVERAMKVYEVLVQALKERQPWIRVAEVLGVSARTVRRLRWRDEHDGFDGLFDHRAARRRRGAPRSRRGRACCGRMPSATPASTSGPSTRSSRAGIR